MEIKKEYDFELNLEFKGVKNPSEAFSQLSKFYDKLLILDNHIAYNISTDIKLEYELVGLEYGSILSKIKQHIENVPDEILKEILNPQALLGHLLVYVKHRILKAIENKEIKSKNDLDKLTNDINNQISSKVPDNVMALSVNNYFILNMINDISIQAKNLKKGESFYFRSGSKRAKVNNSSNINMPKILNELGNETYVQERIEILKIKTMDLLSDSSTWKLKREGKTINVKILDSEWLEEYHNRKFVIQPNDYLKLQLKIIYSTSPNTNKPKVSYEALKVYAVIPPNDIEDNGQIEMFD